MNKNKTEVEILAEEVDEYIKLLREAIHNIVLCPICYKKYIKGQSENGCPYCEIENAKYENALQYTI